WPSAPTARPSPPDTAAAAALTAAWCCGTWPRGGASATSPSPWKRGSLRAWPSAPTARPSPPDTSTAPWPAARAARGWGAAARGGDGPLGVEEGSVWGVAFSPDGTTLAAGYGGRGAGGAGAGRGVVLWDVAARSRLRDEPLPVEEGWVWGVAFS